MQTFTDADGGSWPLSVDIVSARQVRDVLGFDLLALPHDPEALARLARDPILLVDVLSVMLTETIQQRGLDATGFARKLRGAALAHAVDALVESLADFSPPATGGLLRQTWSQSKALTARVESHAQTLLADECDALADAAIAQMTRSFREQVDSMSGAASTNGRESSASTPTAAD